MYKMNLLLILPFKKEFSSHDRCKSVCKNRQNHYVIVSPI